MDKRRIVKMKNIFHWVEIRTHDLEKAKKFYESLFDWKITGEEDENYWLIYPGGEPRGGMWQFPENRPLGVVVYVQVDSLGATLEKVKRLGGKVVLRPIGGRYAAFTDPEGNIIGIWTPEKK